MTTPSTTRKTTPKSAPVEAEKVVENQPIAEVIEETPVSRIPKYLEENSIFGEFCKRYLAVVDEIAEYNKEVLAEKSAEWSTVKVLEKSKELASPDDANVKPNEEVKAARDAWEKLVGEAALAKRMVLEATAKALGITLTATRERNEETEAPLKEKRKLAVAIGTQLSGIAEMTTDKNASEAVTEFFAKNMLPAIGRDQTRTFGDDTKATPKYRVDITVSRDGETLINEAGFTKTSQALTKYYERGTAPKAEFLRSAWEKAGNTPEKTVVSPVEFTDNGLLFSIAKK